VQILLAGDPQTLQPAARCLWPLYRRSLGVRQGLLSGFGYVVARTGPLATVRVTATSPEQRDLQAALFGIGTVEARRAYAIGPTAAGRVQRVRVDVGDVVIAGQLVAEMDPVDLDDRIAAAGSALERAGNALAAAEAQVQETISRQELAEASARRFTDLHLEAVQKLTH
jgi:HlyD family secretion protein